MTLLLAVRAPEPEPFLSRGTLLVLPDRSPAASAGLARASVHPAVPSGPGVAGRRMAAPRLVGVEQPLPEVHEGVEILDVAGRPPRGYAPQEQHLRQEPGPDAGQIPLVELGLA